MTTQELDRKLNAMVLGGKALEAFEELYDDNVVMQENSAPPTLGKAANRQREIEFFSSIGEFHSAAVTAEAVEGDVAFSEWLLDVTFKNGTRYKLEQTAVRRWRDGKVVSERFYYGK